MEGHDLQSLGYSYLSLPATMYRMAKPTAIRDPEPVLINNALGLEMGLPMGDLSGQILDMLAAARAGGSRSYAQAYAGHQFGYFAMLGDGRATMLGEYMHTGGHLLDIQLKGCGRTAYSRGGDGKATLRAMLREYVMSEAMHGLGIPSSRSLAVLKTGEAVMRDTVHEGAALVRVMRSHIRVGTLEYAARLGSADDVRALAGYTVRRLYPDAERDDNTAAGLLHAVLESQIALVSEWMRVGFIHGVMNTDNTSISGETFDYGPCAFMNSYEPATVFSSIDSGGRYAFGQQPGILKWNIARLAEALLPALHDDAGTALRIAQSAIDTFDERWEAQYYQTMLGKIGITRRNEQACLLVDELLDLMKRYEMDYTNTFRELLVEIDAPAITSKNTEYAGWLSRWKDALAVESPLHDAKQLMMARNPVYIPRNHLVEQALDDATAGNMDLLDGLLAAVSHPYVYQNGLDRYTLAPDTDYDRCYQTFCGT